MSCANDDKNKGKGSFIASIVILLLGMTVGLILLSLVYTGPVWVKFIVFIVYITIAYFLVRFAKVYIDALYNNDDKN